MNWYTCAMLAVHGDLTARVQTSTLGSIFTSFVMSELCIAIAQRSVCLRTWLLLGLTAERPRLAMWGGQILSFT